MVVLVQVAPVVPLPVPAAVAVSPVIAMAGPTGCRSSLSKPAPMSPRPSGSRRARRSKPSTGCAASTVSLTSSATRTPAVRHRRPRVVLAKVVLGRVHKHQTVNCARLRRYARNRTRDGDVRTVRRTTIQPMRSIRGHRPRTASSPSLRVAHKGGAALRAGRPAASRTLGASVKSWVCQVPGGV
jgi:hypothetical protein